MPPTDLAELLRLPAEERAELAMALWESLSDSEPDATLEQHAELERRWTEHQADPSSAIPWAEVRQRLRTRI